MILLITHTERNETTGRVEQLVSHGIDLRTGRTVVLPQERPEQIGGVLDRDFGEYVIRDKLSVPAIPSKARARWSTFYRRSLSMSTIFAGGSRSITRLSEHALQRITNIITNKHRVIVGDAGGADTVIQQHLLAANYRDVEVFCSGPHIRNNLGNWPTHHIRPPREAAGFQFYAAKDRAMAEAADFGLMIWDGKSPGTILNVLRLLRAGKAAVLIGSAEGPRSFKSIHHWENFLASCRPRLAHAIKQRATPDEWHRDA